MEKKKLTPEQRALLYKDLCARIPYNVQCEIGGLEHGPYTFCGSDTDLNDFRAGRLFIPYLRPMSSMTEEERQYANEHFFDKSDNFEIDDVGEMFVCPQPYETVYTLALAYQSEYFDWLNAHHFDYRRLIEKNLALEAPERMYNN